MKRHPSRKQLRAWSDGAHDRLSSHIERCDRCVVLLEEMTLLDPGIRQVLVRVTQPRPGFTERIETAVEERRKSAETWSVVGDLFSLGWRTFDALVEEEGEDG